MDVIVCRRYVMFVCQVICVLLVREDIVIISFTDYIFSGAGIQQKFGCVEPWALCLLFHHGGELVYAKKRTSFEPRSMRQR